MSRYGFAKDLDRPKLATTESESLVHLEFMGFVMAYCFMGSMTFFLYCKPMAGFWDPTIKGVKCYSTHLFITFALVNTAFNIFTDVFFATVPIPIIWKLQMKRNVRLYLIGVLSLGYVAVAFGVTNGVYQIAYSTQSDGDYDDIIMFFAILQVNTGIIAACVPSLKPLVSKALKLSDYTHSYSHRNGYNNRYGSRYASQTRSSHWNDPYALEELHSNEDSNSGTAVQANAAGHSATATFFKSGSEERILDGEASNKLQKGIVMTTEINIH
ncbi:hypothetical protein TCE0_044r16372 [Talaromyces pinophilus]|uniref:Rhodopsin domain-containing protein n=1 Tax=Talaromyces pinophilus TaxID=128442 RepID=A0A478EBU4_TALPI|nr:hypothetical protein TCE0_044r16372 [Talaromyces pinophilus]